MAYVRKFKTDTELAAFRSNMAKNRKVNRGGRPKGCTKDPSLAAVPVRSLSIRQPDYEVFVRCAYATEQPIVSFVHEVAESLKAKNPALFAPDAQTVRM